MRNPQNYTHVSIVPRAEGRPHTCLSSPRPSASQGPGGGAMQGRDAGGRAQNGRAPSATAPRGLGVPSLRVEEAPLPCTEPHRQSLRTRGLTYRKHAALQWAGGGTCSQLRHRRLWSMSLHLTVQVQRQAHQDLSEETAELTEPAGLRATVGRRRSPRPEPGARAPCRRLYPRSQRPWNLPRTKSQEGHVPRLMR